jgi:hypothetical protein
MAFKHGSDAAVYLGAVDLSSYLNSADLSVDADTAETTAFQATWKSAIAGTFGAKVDCGGMYDPAQVTLQALILSLVPGVLTYFPGGIAAGDGARLVSAIETSYAESSPVGGVVAVKASFLADGPVGFGILLNPLSDLGASPATTANIDYTASSVTGWQATLHVSAVTAGSWVVKLVDASASNFSDVADVTGGAFTAATIPTSQRLLSASGATLRRYVRAVATRTGGAVGDRITFALAVARNL